MNFPNIVHQIWIQGIKELPKKYRTNLMKNRSIQNKWEHILWDDTSIIQLLRRRSEWINTYYKLEYLHHKVDFARYVILYVYGGAYIDMDAVILKPLDGLVKQHKDYNLLVSYINTNNLESYIHCGNSKCINNGIIIAKQKNSTIKAMIDRIVKSPVCSKLSVKQTCINNITGPKAFTNVVYNNLERDRIKILDSIYLEPCTLDKCTVSDKTYVIHKHDGSWYSSWIRDLLSFYLNHKEETYFILGLLLLLLLIYYYN